MRVFRGTEGGTCNEQSIGVATKHMRLVRASQIPLSRTSHLKTKDLRLVGLYKMCSMNKKDFFKAYQKSGLEPHSYSRSRDLNSLIKTELWILTWYL